VTRLSMALLVLIVTFPSACAQGPVERSSPGAAVSRPPLALTYVANSGVLVAAGADKVLIDALFDRPNPAYRAPTSEVLDKMIGGATPFDGVNLVLVTHNHPDHFSAPVAVRFLESRRNAVLIAPADAVAALQGAAADWPAISPRVVSLDLKVGERAAPRVPGIAVTAFRTLHSGARESPMNLMYQVEFNGWRVFHEGDSPGLPEEYERLGLGKTSIDLALVHWWFPLYPSAARGLREVLNSAHVALTHLDIQLEGQMPARIDAVRKYYRDLLLLLPGFGTKRF
jgi:L-ascorbate metabolism protein UlaG (beta-lactamase superfamily)